MARSKLPEILALDPVRDHERIIHLFTCYEFRFDITRSLEFALFRTYCVPSISALLDKTGEFVARAQKRYDDTDLIISEILENGYSSDRGGRAIRQMNAIHGRFDISNEDFLYVLSTFVFEPLRWLDQYGWRKPSDHERQALFFFWREVGRRMGMREIPETLADFESFNVQYERDHYQYTESNRRIGEATVELFAGWFPRWTRPLVRKTIHTLLDDSALKAFGFPKAPGWLRWTVPRTVRLKAKIVRLLPRRKRRRGRTEIPRDGYPEGYTIENLGPESTTSQHQ